MTVFEIIEAQQAGQEGSPAWMVGEQLKEICWAEPHSAELLAEDLADESMGLTVAAGKIKAWADKQKRTGNCVCVPPNVAEGILREFYGLPGREEKQPVMQVKPSDGPELLDLASFF